jgi:radical SAM protein with 4Fe4S-binding SPASM domain
MRPFPDVVRIEPYGGNCNLRCRHCPTGVLGGKRGLLHYDDFVRIFDSLPFVPRVLVLYHGSEPLLNKGLEDMIAYAKHRGVKKTVLNTNAARLRPLPLLDEMRVSFDGMSAQENDFIRVNSDFEKHAPAVREVARKQKVVIYNAQVSGGEVTEAAPYLKEFFGDLVEYRTIPVRLWSDQSDLFNGGEVVEKPTHTNYCENLFETFTILSDGTVPKCCEDLRGDYLYGNVFEETPLTIWEKMEDIRERFAKKDYPDACAKCWVVAGRYVK